MAQPPQKTRGSTVSNIMNLLRGNFDFKVQAVEETPQAFGAIELISNEQRRKILDRSFRTAEPDYGQRVTLSGLSQIVQTTLTKVGQDRLENRKILQLMPDVAKAARLMIASIFSPSDLSNRTIDVTFDAVEADDDYKRKLAAFATDFFQEKLNLKTAAVNWVYQFGYETGSCVFAIIPLQSFEHLQDQSFIGQEAFVEKVIDPLTKDSFFGFTNDPAFNRQETHFTALESLAVNEVKDILLEQINEDKLTIPNTPPTELKNFITKAIAQESLNLTDNPTILSAAQLNKDKRKKRTHEVLNSRYKVLKQDPIVSISSDKHPQGKNKEGVYGNPIFMRLPSEAVSVIHTPGNPNDHQGYLVLLDINGNPINAIEQEALVQTQNGVNYNHHQQNLFNQIYGAYGLNNMGSVSYRQHMLNRLYTKIVKHHVTEKLNKAGLGGVEWNGMDSLFRCMFSRFLAQKQTRILFLPKELVSYMAFELDENGYGVSRLDHIKFNLGLKMAVQISRVLASIKAAMDRRSINMKFTPEMMEQPEAIFQQVIQQYVAKSTIAFSIDPNIIQSQIADKSLSIKGSGIPGMEDFEVTNEPDQRTAAVDFDPNALEYIDKQIINGLRVPASTMNSLSEDEYARSVVTTNLFFAMDVSLDQDIVIRCVSDVIRKYARYSEEFITGLKERLPELAKEDESSEDGVKDSQENHLWQKYTLDDLINLMSISLPKPNIAPSKAQFEALEAMVQAITNMVTALYPDELAGSDDSLKPTVAFLRSKFTASNIRQYLESSGMTTLNVPESHISDELSSINNLFDALYNLANLMEQKAALDKPQEIPTTDVPGY